MQSSNHYSAGWLPHTQCRDGTKSLVGYTLMFSSDNKSKYPGVLLVCCLIYPLALYPLGPFSLFSSVSYNPFRGHIHAACADWQAHCHREKFLGNSSCPFCSICDYCGIEYNSQSVIHIHFYWCFSSLVWIITLVLWHWICFSHYFNSILLIPPKASCSLGHFISLSPYSHEKWH